MQQYLFLLPIIGWFAVLMAGIVLMALPKVKKAGKNIGRALVLIAVSGVLLFALFIWLLTLAFSVTPCGIYIALSICFWAWLEALTVCLLWKFIRKKAVYITLSIIFALILVIAGIYTAYRVHDSMIPTVQDPGDLLEQYAPYLEGTKAVSLDHEASLRLTDPLPRLDGATALFPIYSSFAEAVYPKEAVADFAVNNRDYGYVSIDWDHPYLTCSTTTTAYENIVTGDADIILVGGPSEEQKKYAEDAGVELVYTPIGKEAFVFFVNAKNPLEDISIDEIKDIYSGKTTEWSDLGVRRLGKIRAFQRDEGSGSQTALHRLMGDTPLAEPRTEDIVDAMGGIITRTADYKNYKNAIGYSFRFYATEMVPNDQIKLLSINGVAPTVENIENGTYPLSSEFYAVTRKDSDENTKAFLEWMTGDEGQEIVKKVGYTPITNR